MSSTIFRALVSWSDVYLPDRPGPPAVLIHGDICVHSQVGIPSDQGMTKWDVWGEKGNAKDGKVEI